MSENCTAVVFSNRAYNTIIRETFDKHPVETGGILLGHVIDGVWVVMEVLPPGIKCIFQHAYFEYDKAFVNYLAQSVANQYETPLQLLGLWHRHPGSMDVFSSTDDRTNSTFASLSPLGAISGLVNVDPNFRLTMYHLERDCGIEHYNRPHYKEVEIEVGDDIIPEQYFKLRFYSSESSNLHPFPTKENLQKQKLAEYTSDAIEDEQGMDDLSFRPFSKAQAKKKKGPLDGLVRHKNQILWTIIFVLGCYCGNYIQGHKESWKNKAAEYIDRIENYFTNDSTGRNSQQNNLNENSCSQHKGSHEEEMRDSFKLLIDSLQKVIQQFENKSDSIPN